MPQHGHSKKPFEETTLEEMDGVIDINLRGVLVTTQAALKHMNNGGRIIMIGSAVVRRACRCASSGSCPTQPRKEPSRCSLRRFPER